MPKFFVSRDKISDGKIIIDTSDVTHITRVLRLSPGDSLTVCDSSGTDYTAVISEISPNRVVCTVTGENKSSSEPELKVTVFQALPKASKMEYIIQKRRNWV